MKVLTAVFGDVKGGRRLGVVALIWKLSLFATKSSPVFISPDIHHVCYHNFPRNSFKFPLDFPRFPLYLNFIVTAKEEILNLIAAEDKVLAALISREQYHKQRTATFKEALETLEKNKASGLGQISKTITRLLEEEIGAESLIADKIAASKTKKEALEQVALSFLPPNKLGKILPVPPKPTGVPPPPPRRPDWDYWHKDLREGTDIFKVRELLRKTGAPVPLAQIVYRLFGVEALDLTKGKYASLRGTLTGYANDKRVFTIESVSPHVIGLLEFKGDKPHVPPPRRNPPPKFYGGGEAVPLQDISDFKSAERNG